MCVGGRAGWQVCRQAVVHVSGVRVQASVHAEIDACMLGFWVTGLLGLLGSCVPEMPRLPWVPGLLGRWVARSPRFLGCWSHGLLLAASGSFWLLLAASGCFWLPLAASGYFWLLLLAASGCFWLSLAASG